MRHATVYLAPKDNPKILVQPGDSDETGLALSPSPRRRAAAVGAPLFSSNISHWRNSQTTQYTCWSDVYRYFISIFTSPLACALYTCWSGEHLSHVSICKPIWLCTTLADTMRVACLVSARSFGCVLHLLIRCVLHVSIWKPIWLCIGFMDVDYIFFITSRLFEWGMKDRTSLT